MSDRHRRRQQHSALPTNEDGETEKEMVTETTSTTETTEDKKLTPQQKYHQRQQALRALSEESLNDLIQRAEGMDESLRDLVLSPLNREKERRALPTGMQQPGKQERLEKYKDAIDALKAAATGFTFDNVSVILHFGVGGTFSGADVRGHSGPRARYKMYTCTVGETEYTGKSLKDLIVKVFPETAKRKAMNKSAYFASRNIEVFGIGEDGSRTKVV